MRFSLTKLMMLVVVELLKVVNCSQQNISDSDFTVVSFVYCVLSPGHSMGIAVVESPNSDDFGNWQYNTGS